MSRLRRARLTSPHTPRTPSAAPPLHAASLLLAACYHPAPVVAADVDSTLQVLALVPARGGSKGIPRKNLQLLGGRPLVAHAVEAALAARLVTRVVCSTDDP